MLSKAKTIIMDGKLLGYIKLQESVFEQLKSDTLIVLERVLVAGPKDNTTLLSFRLKLINAGVKGTGGR